MVNDRHNTMLSEAKREKDILEAVIRVLSRLVVPKRIAENPGTQRIIINAPVIFSFHRDKSSEEVHPLPCLPQGGTSDSTSSLHRIYAPVLDTPGFVCDRWDRGADVLAER